MKSKLLPTPLRWDAQSAKIIGMVVELFEVLPFGGSGGMKFTIKFFIPLCGHQAVSKKHPSQRFPLHLQHARLEPCLPGARS